MQRRKDWADLKILARRNLILIGIAIGLFLGFGIARDTPVGWGVAYTFGTPVTVELPSSCEILTIVRGTSSSSSGTCDGTTWMVDRESHAGTLHAVASDIDDSSPGEMEFRGEARAFGGGVYGRPPIFETVMNLTLLTVTGIGVLALVGCGVAAVLPTRRRRPDPPAPEPAQSELDLKVQRMTQLAIQAGLLPVGSDEPLPPMSFGSWVIRAELALILLAAGVFAAIAIFGLL
ncbi:hypothetical protein ABGB14_47230 [Nonomuraea sp. B10E15]|uniref:hypothetical protein n=1 Tax=Nonomuraea sp. B10E15 TaxID=3153560 RepID=UPI00325DC7EA